MFPTPSFMESNTPALPVSVAPAGGLFKSSIFFQISLYSFFVVDSLEASLQLFYASPFKSATPSATSQEQRYAIFLINNKSILFFIKKITSLQVATSFPLRVFPCHQLATAFPLRVFCCRRLSARNISWWKGVRQLSTGDFLQWKCACQLSTGNFTQWKCACQLSTRKFI